MTPPWEIWHITLQFKIVKFFNFVLKIFLAEISMKFHSEERKTLFLAEISMKFWPFWNKKNNTSIQNQIFSILCLFLAEISLKFYSKDTSLKNMTHNVSFQNQNFSILCLFLDEISMKFHFWMKLVWNFI